MNNKKAFSHFEYLQLKALDCIFNPTDEYLQRKICRWYSKEFNTPLKDVYSIPFDEILTHYYESKFENIPYNDLIDILIEDFLPELSIEKDEENEKWIKELEQEQEQTLKANKKRQSLNNQIEPATKKQSPTSDPALQPEDVVMNFDDNDFGDI